MKKNLFLVIFSLLLASCSNPGGKLNGEDVIDTRIDDIRETRQQSDMVPVYSFYDDVCNYYFYELGTIHNVPLEGVSGLIQINKGMKSELTFSTEEVSVETIENCVSTVSSESVSTSETNGVKISVGGEGKVDGVLLKMAAEYSYSQSNASSRSKTIEETYTKAHEYSTSTSTSISIEFDGTQEGGLYGYLLTGNLKTYSVFIKDRDSGIVSVEYISTVDSYWYGFYYIQNITEFETYSYDVMEFTIDTSALTNPATYADITGNYTPYTEKFTDMEQKSNMSTIQYMFEIPDEVVGNIEAKRQVGQVNLKFNIKFNARRDFHLWDRPSMTLEIGSISDVYYNNVKKAFGELSESQTPYEYEIKLDSLDFINSQKIYLKFSFSGGGPALTTCFVNGVVLEISTAR